MYVEAVIRNELASKYDGLISAEHEPNHSWKGIPNRFPTFVSYLENRCSRLLEEKRKERIEEELRATHEELREL